MNRIWRVRAVALAAVCGGALLGASSASAAWVCATPLGYPGDTASAADTAQWLARDARSRGLPAELPVMAALVESGLRNLSSGDADALGFFSMRTGLWNAGPYAGFATNPQLQSNWFGDQAIKVRDARSARQTPITTGQYGEWIADVIRPPAQYRGRYQLRLAEAQALVACVEPDPVVEPPVVQTPPAGDTVPVAEPPTSSEPVDVNPPALSLTGRLKQAGVDSGRLTVRAACGAEACTATASATFRVPGRKQPYALQSKSKVIAAGATATLALPLSSAARRAARKALRSRPSISVPGRVTVVDEAGNELSVPRTFKLVAGS